MSRCGAFHERPGVVNGSSADRVHNNAWYGWLNDQPSFEIRERAGNTWSNKSACYTMYDVYNKQYPEYFRSVMRLPPQMRCPPPWKLGMHADWVLSKEHPLFDDASSVSDPDFSPQSTPRVKRNDRKRKVHTMRFGRNSLRQNSEASCYSSLTTAGTVGGASKRVVWCSIEGTPEPRGSSSALHDSSGELQSRKRPHNSYERHSRHQDSKRTNLSFAVLKELERQYEQNPHGWMTGSCMPACSVGSSYDKCDSLTSNDLKASNGVCHPEIGNTAFLLHVKNKVTEKLRVCSDARQRKRQIGAVERAELQYCRGALLSDTSCDSQGTLSSSKDDESYDGRMSECSDQSTVGGRIDLEGAHAALRAKLSSERVPPRDIDYELACRLAPRDARRIHKFRRRASNAARIQRYYQQVFNHVFRKECKPGYNRISVISLAVLHECLAFFAIKGRNLLSDVVPPKVASLCGRVEPPLQSARVEGITTSTSHVTKQKSCARSYSHDEKVLVRHQQKEITRVLAELQKQRDRGTISMSTFERRKNEILNQLFEWKGDRVFLKRTTTTIDLSLVVDNLHNKRSMDAGQDTHTVKRLRCSQLGGRGTYCEEERGGRFMLDSDGASSSMLKGASFSGGISHLNQHGKEFHSDNVLSCRGMKSVVSCKGFMYIEHKERMERNRNTVLMSRPSQDLEKERRMKNLERRYMLMRQFDQRAPPCDRMFKQDTSYTCGRAPPERESLHWQYWWNTPCNLFPEWMGGGKAAQNRVLIFPQDRCKV